MKNKKIVMRIIRLFVGLFIFAVGIVMTINANIGLQPWDVLHQGIAVNTNLTIGQASIGVGVLLLLVNFFLGERVGWGTIANILFIGTFMDLIMKNNMIPIGDNFFSGLIMASIGMFLLGLGSYFYLGSELGSGPRDGIMIGLTKRTRKPVSLIRNSIEASALAVGYLLGGFVGIGTVIMALTVGFFVAFAFKIFKFDVSKIQHRFIDEDIKWIKEQLKAKAKEKAES